MSKSPKPGSQTNRKRSSKPGPGRIDVAEMAALMDRLTQLAQPMDGQDVDDLAMPLAGEIEVPLAIPVLRLPHGGGLPLPARQSDGASGLDLCAALPGDAPLTLVPGARALVPTGFAFEIPPSFEGQVRPRSGLALKHGVTVLNSPGTIDSDYRGEIGVILINHGAEPFTIKRGDRIAQLVFGMIVRAVPVEEAALEESARGSGGFGSTGIKSQKR